MCASVAEWWERPPTEHEIMLEPNPQAPAEARAFIRKHLPALGFRTLEEDGVLVATELVTNAVKYAGSYGPIWLSVRLAAWRPLIEVQDCSPELPHFREPDYEAEYGRGLHVVRALCTTFAWNPVEGGKVVYALLRTA
jgi:anti-sigma regulatory factor (Ser/Thr protein kinase)